MASAGNGSTLDLGSCVRADHDALVDPRHCRVPQLLPNGTPKDVRSRVVLTSTERRCRASRVNPWAVRRRNGRGDQDCVAEGCNAGLRRGRPALSRLEGLFGPHSAQSAVRSRKLARRQRVRRRRRSRARSPRILITMLPRDWGPNDAALRETDGRPGAARRCHDVTARARRGAARGPLTPRRRRYSRLRGRARRGGVVRARSKDQHLLETAS